MTFLAVVLGSAIGTSVGLLIRAAWLRHRTKTVIADSVRGRMR